MLGKITEFKNGERLGQIDIGPGAQGVEFARLIGEAGNHDNRGRSLDPRQSPQGTHKLQSGSAVVQHHIHHEKVVGISGEERLGLINRFSAVRLHSQGRQCLAHPGCHGDIIVQHQCSSGNSPQIVGISGQGVEVALQHFQAGLPKHLGNSALQGGAGFVAIGHEENGNCRQLGPPANFPDQTAKITRGKSRRRDHEIDRAAIKHIPRRIQVTAGLEMPVSPTKQATQCFAFCGRRLKTQNSTHHAGLR